MVPVGTYLPPPQRKLHESHTPPYPLECANTLTIIITIFFSPLWMAEISSVRGSFLAWPTIVWVSFLHCYFRLIFQQHIHKIIVSWSIVMILKQTNLMVDGGQVFIKFVMVCTKTVVVCWFRMLNNLFSSFPGNLQADNTRQFNLISGNKVLNETRKKSAKKSILG